MLGFLEVNKVVGNFFALEMKAPMIVSPEVSDTDKESQSQQMGICILRKYARWRRSMFPA